MKQNYSIITKSFEIRKRATYKSITTLSGGAVVINYILSTEDRCELASVCYSKFGVNVSVTCDGKYYEHNY